MNQSGIVACLLVAFASVAAAGKCYSCLYVEGQKDGETLQSITRKALQAASVPGEKIEEHMDLTLKAYRDLGFDMTMGFSTKCNDPYEASSNSATCDATDQCGKIVSESGGMTTVWRGCPSLCADGDRNNVLITCCKGDMCNSGLTLTHNSVLMLLTAVLTVLIAKLM